MKYVAIACLCAGLAACGTTTTDRTVSGAAIGAVGVDAAILGGALAGGAALPGIGILPGAIMGAAAGGAFGAITTPWAQTVNLGKPAWK